MVREVAHARARRFWTEVGVGTKVDAWWGGWGEDLGRRTPHTSAMWVWVRWSWVTIHRGVVVEVVVGGGMRRREAWVERREER